ncbi:MAG: PAS domain-containing sensor histidine kinase, partial [Promethearchaeota archaeon]
YVRRQKGEDVPSRYEFNVVRKNGEKRRVEIISTVTAELNKGITTVAQVLDITEQKQIERKLMESERKFQKIFEAIPDSFLLINKHNVILDFNIKEKDKHLFNDIDSGKKLIDFIPIEYKEEILKIIKEILKTKQPQFIEFQTTHKNKQYFYEIRFLFYSKDSVIAFIRDMTERKKIELLIKEEIRKLKELDELRRDLISTISHEFKTPIMAISGACEILYDGYAKELKDEMFEMLNIIRRNKQRLEYLINNLIDISRSEYKKLLLNKQSHDICIIIREIVNEMQSYSNLRKIDLIMDIPDKLFLDIDVIRMEQVISNLISNAIKNTPPKGKIRISLKTEDNWAILEVKDTGVGLTKNEIKKLFTRFGKIDRIGEDFEFLDIKGSGLGLFISKEIVEKHGGTILAQSKGRFKGSKFTIKLPINKNK